MEDPQANNPPPPLEDEEEKLRREQEEEIERIMLQQEQEQQAAQTGNTDGGGNEHDNNNNNENEALNDPLLQPRQVNDNLNVVNNNNGNINFNNIPPIMEPPPPPQARQYTAGMKGWSYTQTSLGAAVALLVYALRTRQQWYLALVYIRSSKAAYIILANALVATCVGVFRGVSRLFLGGLRLHEAEGLGDFFRWNVTETCLALTMFRSELTVSNGILFLLLVLAKCLHWVADLREGHLRVTEESIVVQEGGFWNGWPILQWQHAKLWVFLVLLQVIDIFAVHWCGQDILTHGPSVSILFGFEAAILLVSAWNNLVLWHLHALDGCMHYLHEQTNPDQRVHRWIHPWKEHKATFTFAVEVQAQAAKFLFYVTFFCIVLTYYGMPINLFREVYVSFQALRQRLVAFAKYRRLMASMNRFQSVNEAELEDAGADCIICRDTMTINDCKKLPGCGHVFHKSCLREWLVQQQSCPTCRGDITAMEQQAAADEARRIAAEARAAAAENEETEQQDEEINDNLQAGVTGPPGTDYAGIPSRPNLSIQAKDSTDNSNTKRVRIGPVIEEYAPFPALYRVVKDKGCPVWDEDHQFIIRTVPFGVVVLCQTLKWRQERGFMMQLPDGWVHEDTVVRVSTLASLKQSVRQQQQQQQRMAHQKSE